MLNNSTAPKSDLSQLTEARNMGGVLSDLWHTVIGTPGTARWQRWGNDISKNVQVLRLPTQI